MPQIMSAETDALAAEYVLGTLDADERAQAHSLLAVDEAFAAKVKVWERRLGELHLMVEPVEPDGRIWQRIKAKMPEVAPVADITAVEPAAEAAAPIVPEVATADAETEVAPTLDKPPAAEPEAAPIGVPAPSAEAAPPTLVAPAPSPSVEVPPAPAPSPPAPVLTPGVTRAPPVEAEAEGHVARIGRRLTRWRVYAALMTLVVVGVAALIAAWRFVPDRLPPMLQAAEVMRLVGVSVGTPLPSPRPKAPPGSEFDE
jgi:hypothetical protein